MAANQNLNGLQASSVVLDEEYTPPTPEERGDLLVEDDADDALLDSEHDDAEEDLEDGEEELLEDEDDADDGEEEGVSDDEEEDDSEDDESEDDESEDDKSEDDKSEDDAADRKGKSKARVPLSRLNKEIEKRRALETELRNLRKTSEQGAQPEPQQTPAKQEKQAQAFTREEFEGMQEAMLDGETDKAFELFGKMMASQSNTVREETEKEVAERVRSEIEQDRALGELRSTAAELSQSYPELDSTSDSADEGLIEEVVELRDMYADRGMPLAEALKKSVHLVALDNGLKNRTEKPKADISKPNKKPLNAKKKLKAAEKERGKLSGSGHKNRPKINIAELGDDEFGQLSKEALAAARGDYVQ